jgi:hypothetical protein
LYEQFINSIGTVKDPLLNELLNQYKEIIYEHEEVFNQLSSIEELILQIRNRGNLDDIKLYQVRDYVYARTTFFKNNGKKNDVRVIVDKLSLYPNKTIEDLYQDELFMNKVFHKIMNLMDSEIEKNMKDVILI